VFKEKDIHQILKTYIDPYLDCDLYQARALIDIDIVSNEKVVLSVKLGYPTSGAEQKTAIKNLLNQAFPGVEFKINLSWKIEPRKVQPGLQSINNIKNIIAVASGKGGVGKSTTAVNLSLALSAEGAKVGLLDADIYGPNQPQMLGVSQLPEMEDNKQMKPVIAHGIESMSIGYLIDNTTPIIWRGPMVVRALLQLLNDTNWQSLDYLLIDMPPGTGDIQLTLAQKVPVCGAVVVTTPQDVALQDARKGIEMFNKVKIPILGVVENMSLHSCSQCGHEESIFGEGGGEKITREYNLALLGRLPLVKKIREQADSGVPIVASEPLCDTALNYRAIAKKMAARLSLQTKNYESLFPNIIIEN
jgi:ATP-binding protein involved in chromosome partitioning